VERAMEALGEIDGRSVSEELVGEIFSHFCVGK
jgi:tRNA U34 5-carboxymethylaminomethyl modifying GTPase MnmE/TrmE